MAGYCRPDGLAAVLGLLAAAEARPLVLAGGTDAYPARAAAEVWMRAEARPVLDISGIAALRGIEDRGDHCRIGALATWSEVREASLPACFDGLRDAARQVGGRQVQNRGTLVGNLCNASPAADGVPPLLTLDACIELASARGVRVLPLAAFLLGNRRTAMARDEIATALIVPRAAEGARGGFLKLGARAYLVISVVMVAAVVELRGGRVAAAKVAVGACSAVARRLPELEAALVGRAWEPELVQAVHLAELAPIDDIRGPATYRAEAALVLLRRLLAGLAAPALERAA